jgi:hypothetical protein
MVKRPVGIHISYQNEEGDEIDQKFYDFHARMILHEMDHLNGKSMTHWALSEGNIDVVRGVNREDHAHLMSTVEFYKNKIDDMKKYFADMFQDQRKHESVV